MEDRQSPEPDGQDSRQRRRASQRSSTLIGEGININVTLLFSQEMYEEVAHAYIRGWRSGQKSKRFGKIASVASFFVSRIDSLVDAMIKARLQDREGIRSARCCERCWAGRDCQRAG